MSINAKTKFKPSGTRTDTATRETEEYALRAREAIDPRGP